MSPSTIQPFLGRLSLLRLPIFLLSRSRHPLAVKNSHAAAQLRLNPLQQCHSEPKQSSSRQLPVAQPARQTRLAAAAAARASRCAGSTQRSQCQQQQQQRRPGSRAAAPAPAPEPAPAPTVRLLPKATTVVNLLGTAGVDKPPGAKGRSWIRYYSDYAGAAPLVCCAEGCYRTDCLSGGHVKIASGPTAAALLHTKWYVVPECPAHNKRSSCKTFRVKQGVVAVEAPPSLGDRVGSWRADVKKLIATLTGKKR